MPKRKHHTDKEHLRRKIKRLQRKLRDRLESDSSNESDLQVIGNQANAGSPVLQPSDWLEPPEIAVSGDNTEVTQDLPVVPTSSQPGNSATVSVLPPPPTPTADNAITGQNNIDLDTDILEILGDDPSSVTKYGPEIRGELATRLLHIATEGLDKDLRRDLMSKYLTPSNCVQIDAPILNPEIKAAIPEVAVRRDRGIEYKQKQLASALTCLGQVMSSQLCLKTKDNDFLQKLMDISRILCDLQYSDSVTRRNFILLALKQDMKEHLKTTKIDTFLFGDNLTETLRSAKAVNRSGVELKSDFNNKSATNRYKTTGLKPLNRRAPAQARRTPGQAPPPRPAQPAPAAAAQWSRAPARPRGQYHPPARPAYSSRMSSQQHQRRRY